MLDLQNIKPGSYKYKFLINGTTFCDQSLPHKEDFFDRRNVFIIWSNNFPPSRAERVTINAQVTLPWKVQLTGNWPVQPKTIDCQVRTKHSTLLLKYHLSRFAPMGILLQDYPP